MILMELGAATAEPVTTAELKAWCRIERDDEDALLAALGKAAREAIESETRLVLARRGFRLSMDEAPAGGRIALARGPVRSVTAIVAYGADGTPKSLAPGGARIEPDHLRLAPAVTAAVVDGLEIDLVLGLDPAEVPEALKLALKQIVSASYEIRASVAPDRQPGLIPPAARALIAPHREWRL